MHHTKFIYEMFLNFFSQFAQHPLFVEIFYHQSLCTDAKENRCYKSTQEMGKGDFLYQGTRFHISSYVEHETKTNYVKNRR